MSKIAFVFSGQGDQYVGMGKEIFDVYPEAKNMFYKSDMIRKKTSEQCFYGTEDELKETKNTQPCLFALEAAIANVLEKHGVCDDMAAGFSLGEVVALTYGGVFDFETGFSLVCKRGELMQAAAEKMPTSMAAVLRLSDAEVERLCGLYKHIYPVNYNSPGQVAVSGDETEMAEFYTAVKEAGGRTLPLKVKGGFHSPYMDEASALFEEELKKVTPKKAKMPIYSDVTAQPYGDDIKNQLAMQIASPVLWKNIIVNMIGEGMDTFIEIGPGKTLCNLISKTDKSVRVYSTSSVADIEKILSEVR